MKRQDEGNSREFNNVRLPYRKNEETKNIYKAVQYSIDYAQELEEYLEEAQHFLQITLKKNSVMDCLIFAPIFYTPLTKVIFFDIP